MPRSTAEARLRSITRRAGLCLSPLLCGLMALLPSPSSVASAGDRYVLLTFLHTNDLHGRVVSGVEFERDDRGGLARAASLVRQLRATMPHVLFLDSGDLIHGSPVAFLDQGRSMIDAMNAAGVDLACPGNHEFDWGRDAAQDAMRRAKFPWVTANVVDDRTGRPIDPATAYQFRTVDGVRIAFFGLTTLETVDLEWPPFLAGLRFLDPIETARALVPVLRSQADLVVLVSHLGLDKDAALAAQVPGIDLIFGGHSHTTLRAPVPVNGSLIMQAGYYGQYLGRLDLIVRKGDDGVWRIASVNGRDGRWWRNQRIRPLDADYPTSTVLPLGPEIVPDPSVVAAYRDSWDEWHSLEARPVGEASDAIRDDGAPGDTPLSRFLADRLREATGADVAIVDGKWTGALPAGTVRTADIWNAMGGYTGQNVLKCRVTGAEIRRFLDQWAGLTKGLAVGVSGLTAVVDPSASEGRRVVSASIDGKPLDDSSGYVVAGVMYVLRRFPELMDAAPARIDGPIEWSRPMILEAARKLGKFAPDLKPRLVVTGRTP